MAKVPDINVKHLRVIQSIVTDKQDELRNKNRETEHLSECQQALNKLINFYE